MRCKHFEFCSGLRGSHGEHPVVEFVRSHRINMGRMQRPAQLAETRGTRAGSLRVTGMRQMFGVRGELLTFELLASYFLKKASVEFYSDLLAFP